jgi:4-amino-4-deoxychorismate lyase
VDVVLFRVPAGRAPAEHGEMGPVEDEALLLEQPALQRGHQIGRRVDDGLACVADDVDVFVLRRTVGRGAVIEVRVPDDAEFLEQFEGAVDGGEVDVGHGVVDLFRRRVVEVAHRGQDLLTLGGHPQPALAQARRQVRPFVHVMRVPCHNGHRRYRGAVPVRLVAVLGTGIVDPATPIIRADDPGVTRGDGCFEGCRLRTSDHGASRVDKVDLHLARMSRSAAALGIPFEAAEWSALVESVCAAWRTPGEWPLKLVLTRSGAGFLTVSDLPPEYPRQRRDGLRVICLPRGYERGVFEDAPWLLGGVKTLSYAVNMAAQREAERLGVDDVIFLAADDTVLETPTGTVVWSVGRTLHTVPTGATGILGGTTVALLFERAAAAGWTVAHTLASVDDLHAADAVWVISSVRGPVGVVELDGRPHTRVPELDAQIRRLVDF